MHNPELQAAELHHPIAARWRRVRAAYRMANMASHHVLGFTIKLVLLVYFLFAIVFLFLRYAILPNIDYYKGNIEHLASRALGNDVKITRIYASWRGLRPYFFLGDVILRNQQGQQVLSLPSVSATLSWWSVPTLQARFHSLEIIRPDLDVRRTVDGRILVAGIALGQSGGEPGGSDWAFRQREIVIREGRVTWTDQVRGAPTLALSNVNLLLRNRWQHHRMAVSATPPASLSGPLDVRADFTHPRFAARVSDMAQWTGELYADMRNADLAAAKAYLDYPFEVTSARGSVRAWLTLDRAKLAAFTADVGLVELSARLGKTLPPLQLASMRGRISASETFASGSNQGRPAFGAHGHRLKLDNFSIVTPDGLTMAPTTLAEQYTPARAGKPDQVQISARALDLEMLARLAGQLPLSVAQRTLLADFSPRGRLSNFSAQWSGAYPAIASYKVAGRLDGFGVLAQAGHPARAKTARTHARAARAPIPGFENLSGTVQASDKGGVLNLDAEQVLLHLPGWFAEPAMPLDQLKLKARWSFPKNDALRLQIESMQFAQGKLSGTLSGQHVLPLEGGGKGAGVADLSGSVSGFELKQIDRFLPLQTPDGLRMWLSGALEGGTANDVTLRLQGDLARFPFKAGQGSVGQFRVAGKLEQARLNYAPGQFAPDGKAPLWPQASAIDGRFVFDGARMEIIADKASTLGVGLSDVKAVVADLTRADKQLDITGSANGPLPEFLRYMGASPVSGWIGHFTDQARATGKAALALKLQLPLANLHDTRVQGALQLMGNEVQLFKELPPLHAAIGKIEFNERGVDLNGVGASFLGGPLALTGGSARDGAIVVKLGGTVAADGLRRAFPAPSMQRVLKRITGSTRYSGVISVQDRQAQVSIDSAMLGLGLDFPAPLSKPAASTLPLRFSLVGKGLDATGAARDEIRISLGETIAARYLRQKKPGAEWRVLRGGVGVNVPAPEPDSGMMVNVKLASLNVDQWVAIGGAIAGKGHGGAAGSGNSAAAGAPLDIAQYIVPDVMAARADELIIADRKLDNVVVGASHQDTTWQASIDSRQASGHVSWSAGAGGHGLGKVTARLASLIIPESSAAAVKDLLEGGKNAASSIPALDIVAERFELFNKQLGRLELVASNGTTGTTGTTGTGREWRIDRLSLVNADGTLTSTGKWGMRNGQSTTNVDFVLAIADAGKLLDRFGFPETLRRGAGTMRGTLSWNGLPYSLDIPSLSGKLALDIASGQFLKQDPGAAKLLGVLSLQMLPRMLKLDFTDVFSEGLAFDGISADATIERGLARTNNLKMHGVAATVLMDGTADIANETSNLHVVVIPEFNLGTGPLVYALAVNPLIGIGSFLAQLFLRDPVMKALTYEMQITGPWKTPVITKLDGKSGKPAPATNLAQ